MRRLAERQELWSNTLFVKFQRFRVTLPHTDICGTNRRAEVCALGTAGATLAAASVLGEEFLLVYGDLLFDIDVSRFCARARDADGHGTLAVHPNDHPFDSDPVSLDPTGRSHRGRPS